MEVEVLVVSNLFNFYKEALVARAVEQQVKNKHHEAPSPKY